MEHYIVVSDTSKHYFEIEVNELIKKGYKPLGNLVVNGTGYDKEFYQAMIKIQQKDKDTIWK